MNIKVVVVWVFGIIFFMMIGLFGYFNRDLVVSEIIDPEAPEVPQLIYESKTCKSSNDNGDITYTFRINPETKSVERVFATYDAIVENIDVYASATNVSSKINGEEFKGVNSQINGTSKDFSLNVNVNIMEYEKEKMAALSSDLRNVGMIFDTITDYDNYVSTLSNSFGITFDCE